MIGKNRILKYLLFGFLVISIGCVFMLIRNTEIQSETIIEFSELSGQVIKEGVGVVDFSGEYQIVFSKTEAVAGTVLKHDLYFCEQYISPNTQEVEWRVVLPQTGGMKSSHHMLIAVLSGTLVCEKKVLILGSFEREINKYYYVENPQVRLYELYASIGFPCVVANEKMSDCSWFLHKRDFLDHLSTSYVSEIVH